MAETFRVGLLGHGTVGSAFEALLAERAEAVEAIIGERPQLTGVLTRSRGSFEEILEGSDLIVELIGGLEPAREYVLRAMQAGKHVVSANKQLLSNHGEELWAAAREHGVQLRFEGAVAGVVPVIRVLQESLAAARIERVHGIVNGTTNYILSAMADEARGYDDVLAAAQAAGYAEADPSGDVEGHDAVNKLVILARLAFGVWLDPESIATTAADGPGAGRPGITGITADAIAAAARAGTTIKLVVEARRDADRRIVASVLPTAVPADSGLGRTGGVLNRIEIEAEPVGTVAFSGPGAGGPATSSAVLADLVAVGRELGSTWAGLPPAGRAP